LKGKFADLLQDIWNVISEEDSDPFVDIIHLEEKVGRRLRENITLKKDI